MNKNIPFVIGGIYDFYDDGKIKESRRSKMRVMEFIDDLFFAKYIFWNIEGRKVSLWDIWKKTIKTDLKRFDSISYRIFDWGCSNFVVCNPIECNGKVDENTEVYFARTTDGKWYTIEDDEWNGLLMIPNSDLEG